MLEAYIISLYILYNPYTISLAYISYIIPTLYPYISYMKLRFGEATTDHKHLVGVGFGLLSALCGGGAYVIIRFLGTAVKAS